MNHVIVICPGHFLVSTLKHAWLNLFQLFFCLARWVRKSSAGNAHRHLSVVILLLRDVSLTLGLTHAPILLTSRKHAIETAEMLDFLKELVKGVHGPFAGGTIPLDAPSQGEPTTLSSRAARARRPPLVRAMTAMRTAVVRSQRRGGDGGRRKRRAMRTAVPRMEIEKR